MLWVIVAPLTVNVPELLTTFTLAVVVIVPPDNVRVPLFVRGIPAVVVRLPVPEIVTFPPEAIVIVLSLVNVLLLRAIVNCLLIDTVLVSV